MKITVVDYDVSIPYGAIRWIYAGPRPAGSGSELVSIPYGAIRWIYPS